MERVLGIFVLTIVGNAMAATLTVTTTDDTLANDGQCSLREAITAANTNTAFNGCAAGSGADLILLGADEYRLDRPGAGEDGNVNGDLDISSTLTISGAGADVTRIRGDRLDRVFDLRQPIPAQPIAVTLNAVTIRNGEAAAGGAIQVAAGVMLTIDGSGIVNNVAAQGGGIASFGTLEVRGSVFHANSADSGGALWTGGGGTTIVRNVTFDANSSTRSGSVATFTAPATLNNVTMSQNIADSDLDDVGDGAIEMNVIVTVSNSIIARNIDLSLGGSALLNPDCMTYGPGSLVSRGHNLIGNIGATLSGGGAVCALDAAASDQVGNPAQTINPRLQPFAMYGGTVETYLPLASSPAVERGSMAAVGEQGACEAIDARAVTRPQGLRCDIGAAELEEIIFRDGFDLPLP